MRPIQRAVRAVRAIPVCVTLRGRSGQLAYSYGALLCQSVSLGRDSEIGWKGRLDSQRLLQ